MNEQMMRYVRKRKWLFGARPFTRYAVPVLLAVVFVLTVLGTLNSSSPWNPRSLLASTIATITGRPLRRVYLDLGANWGQTLDLHVNIDRVYRGSQSEEAFGGSWEVYSFEASPWIQAHVERLVCFRNRRCSKRPSLPFPHSGSSVDLSRFASKAGCPRNPINQLRSCMLQRYLKHLRDLKTNPALNSTALLRKRLNSAAYRNWGRQTRYTFIPAAVAASDGTMPVKQSYLQLLIGGIPSFGTDDVSSASNTEQYFPVLYVNTVDIVSWLLKHFSASDYVIVKMDVEGAEFQIIPELIRRRADKIVDVLAWECHNGRGGQCSDLQKMIAETNIRLMSEGKDYHGWN